MKLEIAPSFALLALAAAIAGCGSTPKSPASLSETSTSPPRQASVSQSLPGAGGGPATPAKLARLQISPPSVRADFKGLENLTLTQKMTRLSAHSARIWAAIFRLAGLQLPPATATVIDQTPGACGAEQIATTDPPRYCSQDATIELPLAFMQSNVAPIGDAAVALVVADQYGYHVETALGLLKPGSSLSVAEQQKIDSCLAGLYFLELEAENRLQGNDEIAVKRLLAAKAGSAGSGGASAADLTTAFNTGIRAHFRLAACLPAGTPAPAPTGLAAVPATATPADFQRVPANATGWLALHLGTWDYKVPPDHSYATTAANPSGIDITSTGGAHFGVGILSGSPYVITLDQISKLIFSTGAEDTTGVRAQITATVGPFTGSAGSQDELIAWSGTRQDGTPATGLVEIEDFGYGYIDYVLDGPSSSWSTDIPTLLAIKANTMYTPAAH